MFIVAAQLINAKVSWGRFFEVFEYADLAQSDSLKEHVRGETLTQIDDT